MNDVLLFCVHIAYDSIVMLEKNEISYSFNEKDTKEA